GRGPRPCRSGIDQMLTCSAPVTGPPDALPGHPSCVRHTQNGTGNDPPQRRKTRRARGRASAAAPVRAPGGLSRGGIGPVHHLRRHRSERPMRAARSATAVMVRDGGTGGVRRLPETRVSDRSAVPAPLPGHPPLRAGDLLAAGAGAGGDPAVLPLEPWVGGAAAAPPSSTAAGTAQPGSVRRPPALRFRPRRAPGRPWSTAATRATATRDQRRGIRSARGPGPGLSRNPRRRPAVMVIWGRIVLRGVAVDDSDRDDRHQDDREDGREDGRDRRESRSGDLAGTPATGEPPAPGSWATDADRAAARRLEEIFDGL